MEKIFEKLGYDIFTQIEPEATSVKFYVVRNKDHTIKWLWPSHTSRPLIDRYLSYNGIRTILYSLYLQIVFVFRLQNFIYESVSYNVKINTRYDKSVFDIKSNWILVSNKLGIWEFFVEHENSIIKVLDDEAGTGNFDNEAYILNMLSENQFESIIYPKLIYQTADILKVSNVLPRYKKKFNQKYSSRHMEASIELESICSFEASLGDLDLWKNLKSDIAFLSVSENKNIPMGLVKKMGVLIGTFDERKKYVFSLSHGDFTTWNIQNDGKELAIQDWGKGNLLRPLGFDFYHYIIQNEIINNDNSWVRIKEVISHLYSEMPNSIFAKLHYKERREYLVLYLLFYLTDVLKQGVKTSNFDLRFFKWLRIYNVAVSEMLPDKFCHRKRVLLDLFDTLMNVDYGALKFPRISPDLLSEYSDVDLCMKYKDALNLQEYLKNHPLVLNVTVNTNSHTKTLSIQFKDGSLLSIDLIWKLKYKDHVMFDIKHFIENTYNNGFGVKLVADLYTARFIGLFYILNNSKMPEKRKEYAYILSNSNCTLDQHLFSYFNDGKGEREAILSYLNKKKYNSKRQYINNKLGYWYDTIKLILFSKGLIMTFSGIEGVGKGTIIEKVKYIVEKQFRKRVIVLNHRPSILPILSRWSEGSSSIKILLNATNLQNVSKHSQILSFVKFSYYYLDYFLGQFYIYFRYIIKGYVVLYDRFYFDFINDSKRSNITLPKDFIKVGYNFLMKPKLNIFLYTDPQTIIAKKNGLEENIIVELNKNYKELFLSLSEEFNNSKYIALKNERIDKTLTKIIYVLSPMVI